MSNLDSTSADLDKRRAEFGEAYEDFETWELVRLVIAAGDFLEQLTWEPEAVDKAMKVLHDQMQAANDRGDLSWREAWDAVRMEPGVIGSSDYFVDLNAFAYFGLPLDIVRFDKAAVLPADKQALGEVYARHIAKGRDMLRKIPANWADVRGLERTILASEARLSLDFGRDVSVDQLAALSGMTPKSIRNLFTPKSGEEDLRASPGIIPADVALRWLEKRPDFRSSMWWLADPVESAGGNLQPNTDIITEAVFVPIAKDGTWFHPIECRNSRGYTIGPKGAEIPLDDYFEALKALTQASSPHWRRPNSAGNWGIVTGVSWTRKDARELRTMLEARQ